MTTQPSDPLEVELPPASGSQGGRPDLGAELLRGTQLIRDKAVGLTYAQLAEKHGYADASGARHAFLRAMARHEAENAAHLRAVENERYELDQAELRAIIMDRRQAAATRIKAIDARTRAAARFARLNGLDAPVQVAISAGVQAELADALVELSEVVLGEVVDVSDELLARLAEGTEDAPGEELPER